MSVFDTGLDYTKLIQFTDGTLQLASFVQIRNALIKRFKEIYGNDIDVDPASGDGQYINSIALLINNIFQTVKQGYDSLDPAIASGQYLDTLCSYNNIFRIKPTASIAQLEIYNSSSENLNVGPERSVNHLDFIDRNNEIWSWYPSTTYIFKAGTITNIDNVKCEKLGAISAPGAKKYYKWDDTNNVYVEVATATEATWNRSDLYASELNGTIYQTVGYPSLWVWQYKDAEIGNDEETDEALRSRRYQMLGNTSVTVLEGLKGSLLNLVGIEDVYIFNNNSGASITLDDDYKPIADGTVVAGHSIYVAIRYKENIEIPNATIGRLIYNKLTPGINTSPLSNPSQDIQEFEIDRTVGFKEIIRWKKCSSVKPQIVLYYLCNTNYDYLLDSQGQIVTTSHEATTTIEKNIVSNLQKYLSKVKISTYLTITEILNVLQQSDILKQNMSTFFVQKGGIDGADETEYPMNLNYLKYADSDYQFQYNTTTNIATLTIG